MMPSRLGRHAAVTFVGTMASNVLAYVFYGLVSRAVGVDAYGTFSALVNVVLIACAPAQIGQMVVAKLASDFASDPAQLSGLVRAIDRVTVLAALSGAAVFAALSVPIARFLHLDDTLLVTLAALSLCGAVALPLLRGILQGTSAFGAYALSNIAENVGKAVFGPLLALVAGLRGALGGMALGFAGAAVYTFVVARPHGRAAEARFSLRTVVRSSAAVAASVITVNVLLFFDVILAKRYLDAHTAGLYGAAALSARTLFAVIVFVPIVLLPQAAGRWTRGERTRWLYLQALGAAAAMSLCAAVFFALFPRFVITMMAGRAAAAGAPLVFPYVCAIAALSLANVTAVYNIARGRLRFVVPLVCVAAGEIVAIVLRHRAAADLLQTIVIGHTLALLAATTSLGGASRGTAALGAGSEAA